jgi:Tol biopolymer transport system component/tRNA A-37 threonylcarbamoyl transferase component Bud32
MPEAAPRPSAETGPVTVGPYTIIEEIGAGGMGRVYRAHDARLNREVAVKMLHEAIGAEDPRVRRFLEEARTAGGLSHPNILAVYDVGTDAGRPYIVSELIDGGSLRRQMDAGAIPLARALDLAVQIADGLTAAHHAGLVHRDLKPDNLMVTKSGRVKIVDFGLAKVVHTDSLDGSDLRTLTAPHVVLGTAAYMSPEQARGSGLDFRSDLFSFGSILYEMVTRRRAFERPTPIETLTAVLHDEPPPLAESNPRAPQTLQSIVERCLAKSPADRYAATADLHHDLRDLREKLPGIPGPRTSRPWLRALAAAGAITLAASVAVAVTRFILPRGVDLTTYRYLPLATEPGYEGSAVWSPDGRTVAYIAERDGLMQVMIKSLEASRPIQITHAVADCRSPFWSADGTRVFYISRAGVADGLWSVATIGGTPSIAIQNVSAATLSPDGRALVFVRDETGPAGFRQSLWVRDPIDAADSEKRFAPGWRGGGVMGVGFVRFSPDGATVALWANPSKRADGETTIDNPEIWLFPYPSGQPRQVLRSLGKMSRAHPFSWMPDSRHIVFGADLIGRSPGTQLFVGDTRTNTVMPLAVSTGNSYEPDVSRDGQRVAFTNDESHYDLVELPLNGTAPRVRLATGRDEADPAWAARGAQFAYVTDRFGHPEIWASNAEGTIEKPVVTARSFQDGSTYLLSRVAFAPDGQRLAYQRRNDQGYFIWVSTIDGGTPVQPISSERAAYQDAPTWSPNGEWIAFSYNHKGRWRLGKMRPGVSADFTMLRDDVNFPANLAWSPDGRWISCELQGGLFIISPDGREERMVSEEPGLRHAWSHDSSKIIAVRQTIDNRLQLVSIDIATRQERVLTADLGPSPPATPQLRGFSLSPDGSHVLTSIIRLRADLHVLDGFAHNFFMSSPRLEQAR